MKKVYVSGVGIISSLGTSVNEVWERLNQADAGCDVKKEIEYESVLPARARRRMNRYSDMVVYTSVKAVEDAGVEMSEMDSFRAGTIFSTGYGPMVSNLKFANMVLEGDPDVCSPTVFASTVSNACVGHVCMNLGCKGVSTIVMGSNNVGYSQMLLDKGDADYILAGSVEEYCEPVYNALKANPYCTKAEVAEATVSFLLHQDENKEHYCTLLDFCECSLGKYPLIDQIDEEDVKVRLKKALSTFLENNSIKVDTVFTVTSGNYFDKIEKDVLKEVLPEDVVVVDKIKEYAGETLGSSFNVALAIGALCMRENKIPEKITSDGKGGADMSCALVTGYDVTGNYIAYLIAK